MSAGLRILLVDDVAANRALIGGEITRDFRNARLLEADSPEAIRDALAAGPVDVVVTRYGPGGDPGRSVLEMVRQRVPDCPVIVCSSEGSEEAAVEAIRSGAADFVQGTGGGYRRLGGAIRSALDHRRDREAIRRSEERYRRFFHENVAANYIALPDGALLDCNPAYCSLFGFDEQMEAMNTPISSLFPSESGWEAFTALLRENGKVELMETELLRPDRKPVQVMQTAVATLDAHGHIREIRAYLLDMTERRKLEAQLLQSQKMEALGRLAGSIAHDFNNILTAISGYSELLLIGLGERHPMSQEVQEIKKAGERAAELARQLLSFSRQRSRRLVQMEINKVLGDMENMIRRLIGEDIRLEVVAAPDAGCINADPGQIEQVIMNLAVNARDAMPTGGILRIETALVVLDADYCRTQINMVPGPYTLLRVSDTGCGMSAETMEHLFEPFYTTKEKGKGTGLGLSTVYGIVKGFSGMILVSSEPGTGTEISIYFPRIETRVPEAAGASPPVFSDLGYETILLVEDEESVRRLAARLLDERGYRVLTASGYEEALRVARSHEGVLHLLVTDLVLAGKGGGELAWTLRQERPRIRVLFISGYSDTMIASHKVFLAGAEFLEKPFSPEALARKVRGVLDNGLDLSMG